MTTIDQYDLGHALMTKRRRQRHHVDSRKIVNILRAESGVIISQADAEEIWQWHSDRACAQWMSLGHLTNMEILEVVGDFIRHYSNDQ
jgi:hypothetical protein